MRYCPQCDTEYVEGRERCVEDGALLLDRRAWEAELARQGRIPEESRHFRRVASTSDRFRAEAIARQLTEESIEAFVVSSRAPTTGMLGEPARPVYRVIVPDADEARARSLASEWEAELERTAGEAAAAAELEEAQGEQPPPSGPAPA